METLTAHSRPDLGIPVPGVGKGFEMHPSASSTPAAVNPATRMPAPTSAKLDDNKEPQYQEQRDEPVQKKPVSPGGVQSAGAESSQPSSPVVSQNRDQSHDASQPDDRLQTPDEKSNSQTDTKSSPTRHKRTAGGLLKPVDTPADVRPRAESVSSSGSKAGEVAQTLKTRLAYAMAKVQHGWEHRNINEVEKLAASLRPRAAVSPSASSAPIDIQSPPSKRRSASGVVSWSLPDSGAALVPPVNLSSSQNSVGFKRPLPSSPPAHIPSTPKTRPPSIHVMPTQQAEQDAMDALMLMGGSPGNGGKFPHLSQSSSSQHMQQSQSQQNGQSQGSTALGKHGRSDSLSSLIGTSPKRPIMSRNNSSASDVSVANSEVREARERILDEAEEAA